MITCLVSTDNRSYAVYVMIIALLFLVQDQRENHAKIYGRVYVFRGGELANDYS